MTKELAERYTPRVKIRYSKAARKALLRSDKRLLLREKIELLVVDPDALQANVTQLRGRPEWRLRVQDWRIIFVRGDDELLIRDIAPRGRVYEVR